MSRKREAASKSRRRPTRALARQAPSSALSQLWLTGLDTLNSLASERISRPFAQHPTVYRAVRTIATSFTKVPPEVFPESDPDAKPVEDHWFTKLLSSPGQNADGITLSEAVVTSLLTKGEVFLWHQELGRGADGARGVQHPQQLWLLWPEHMMPVEPGPDPGAWKYMGMTKQATIPSEELTFIKLHNPYDELRGLSPLQAAFIEYVGDYKASVWNRAFLENSTVPPIIFTVEEKPWPYEQRKAFLETWEDKLRGPARRGRAAALPPDVKAQVLKTTHQEMDFLGGREHAREQILSVYGVPPAIAGIFQYANYANSAEQKVFFWQDTMTPLVLLVQGAYNRTLLQRYDPAFVLRYKLKSVLAEVTAGEFGKKVDTAGKLWAMGFSSKSINDRMDLGMEIKPDEPWHEEGFLPFSVTPARLAVEEPEDEPEDEPLPVPGDDDEQEEEEENIRARAADGTRAALWSGLAKQYADIGRGFYRKYRTWLAGVRREVMANLEAEIRRETEGRGIDSELPAVGKGIDPGKVTFNAARAEVRLRAIEQPSRQRAIERGASTLRQAAGIAVDFKLTDPAVIAYMAFKEVKIKERAQDLRDAVAAAVAEGVRKGENITDVAKRVQAVRDEVDSTFNVSRGRAVTIARTETAQAFGFGRHEQMKQAGIAHQSWLTSRDDRVRDSHAELDGEVVAVGDTFSNGLEYPGDISGPPEEVINCRCNLIPEQSKD